MLPGRFDGTQEILEVHGDIANRLLYALSPSITPVG